MRYYKRSAGFALLALSGLLFSLAFTVAVAKAQPAGQAPQVLTIAAGQTGTIHLRGFCLDPGLPFPTGISNPSGLAKDEVRSGLYYAVQKGYDRSNPRQVQQAVWFLETGTWQNDDHVLAQEIVDAAADPANKPPEASGATSLVDAISANNVTASITFTPAPDVAPNQAFYGDGDLTITNSSTQELKVYMPFGMVFPPQNSGEQRLVGYELSVEQPATPTAAATNTTAPAPTNTTAPAPTNTTAPAPAATSTPTGTTLPTTGAGDDGNIWPGILIGVALLALAAGLLLVRREEINV